MHLIRFMLRTAHSLFVLSVLCSIVGGLATTALLVTINSVLHHGVFDGESILSFCLLVVGALGFRTVSALLLARLGQSALFHLRMSLSRQIVASPLRKLEEIGPSSILAVLTDDVPAIINFVANVPLLCTNSAILLACLAYMATLSQSLLGVVLIFLGAGVASYAYLTRVANRHIVRARNSGALLLQHFRSLLSGMKELKLHRRRRNAFMESSLETTAMAYREHMVAGLGVYAGAMAWGELLMFMAIAVVVFVAFARHDVAQSNLLPFVLVLLYLVGPLDSVINLAPQAGRASVGLKSVHDLGLALPGNEPDTAEARLDYSAKSEEIALHQIVFEYRSDESADLFSLGPLTVTFPPGQLVFIVGGNGSGKSTLAKLITGLYAPASGELTIGKRLVNETSRDIHRQRFTAVFSDFHLFEALLGFDSGTIDEAATVRLEQLQLSHKVQVKEGVFSTIDLSQGQRKRLALLTAYLEDRPFYLFDEWAADQDPLFKEIFYYEILPDLQRRGKTIFVITHDDRFFHVADRIIKLESGYVVSDELLKHNLVAQARET